MLIASFEISLKMVEILLRISEVTPPIKVNTTDRHKRPEPPDPGFAVPYPLNQAPET